MWVGNSRIKSYKIPKPWPKKTTFQLLIQKLPQTWKHNLKSTPIAFLTNKSTNCPILTQKFMIQNLTNKNNQEKAQKSLPNTKITTQNKIHQNPNQTTKHRRISASHKNPTTTTRPRFDAKKTPRRLLARRRK